MKKFIVGGAIGLFGFALGWIASSIVSEKLCDCDCKCDDDLTAEDEDEMFIPSEPADEQITDEQTTDESSENQTEE